MWLTFVLVFAIIVAILYIPGTLFARSFGVSWTTSICVAPVYAMSVTTVLSIVLSKLGIEATAIVFTIVVFTLAVLVGVVVRFTKFRPFARRRGAVRDWVVPALYVSIGCLVTGATFVYGLDGANSFLQAQDQIFHYSSIRTMLETADWSALGSGYYPAGSVSPSGTGWGFYPSVFHSFCAYVISLTGADFMLCINAVLAVFLSVVYPLSFLFMMRACVPDNVHIQISGAFLAGASGAFPWMLLMYWPLTPYCLALLVVPFSIGAFVSLASGSGKLEEIVLKGGCFVAAMMLAALCQTSSIFYVGTMLVPYMCYKVFGYVKEVTKSLRRAILSVFALLCLVVVAWLAFYNASFMQGVVQYDWPSFMSYGKAALAVVSGSTVLAVPQYVLTLLFILGVLWALRHRRYSWMVVSACIMAFIFYVDACTDGELKHIVSGFWYTDPYRTAALFALSALPVCAMGLAWIGALLSNVFSKMPRIACVLECLVCGGALILSMFVPFGSEISMARMLVDTSEGFHKRPDSQILTEEEYEFLSQVKNLVGDSLVLNQPFDGSVFGYSLYDLNLYYRTINSPNGWSEESDLVREHLDDIDDMRVVADVVDSLGAEYVLDLGNSEEIKSIYPAYSVEDWLGYDSLANDSEHFVPILKQGDMVLYRIVS